ncbi:MAG: hypothetical protein M0C28_18320 [Candidatus Moduliflexus flocculans]|nr:hypothetical protein [Candidatus Moduliflexus flocculans]
MIGLLTFNLGPSFKRTGFMVEELIATGFPDQRQDRTDGDHPHHRHRHSASASSPPSGRTGPADYLVMFIATLGVTIPVLRRRRRLHLCLRRTC